MVNPATEWFTLTEASVPSEAHQWTFLAHTDVIIWSHQHCGSDLNVVISSRISHSLRTLGKTPSMQVVFSSLKQREDAPLWESLTWERATQLSITSNSKQEALNGGIVYLEQLWLSQVLMNTNWWLVKVLNSCCWRVSHTIVLIILSNFHHLHFWLDDEKWFHPQELQSLFWLFVFYW